MKLVKCYASSFRIAVDAVLQGETRYASRDVMDDVQSTRAVL
jgi:hypothetical protein